MVAERDDFTGFYSQMDTKRRIRVLGKTFNSWYISLESDCLRWNLQELNENRAKRYILRHEISILLCNRNEIPLGHWQNLIPSFPLAACESDE